MSVYLKFRKSWCKCNNYCNRPGWLDVFLFLQKCSPRVNIFNKTSVNIFSNFIPNKIINFDDKDPEKVKEKKLETWSLQELLRK